MADSQTNRVRREEDQKGKEGIGDHLPIINGMGPAELQQRFLSTCP